MQVIDLESLFDCTDWSRKYYDALQYKHAIDNIWLWEITKKILIHTNSALL